MRILIIDDSPADRELAIRALEREFAGAEYVEIGRKPEFGEALVRGGFDAVLTDFRLHWSDGLRVLQEVKERYPYLPVIFMTESGSEEIAVEGMKAGLSDYVLKHHPQRLPIAVREGIEKSRLRRDYDQALLALQEAHAELRQAAEGLEQRVAERTAELARANEDLRTEMSERRRAEQERERLLAENRQQRELLEHLVAAAPVGIALVGAADGCYRFANPAYLAITGKAADLAGRPFGAVSPDLAGLATELLPTARETGQTVSVREFERAPTEHPDTRAYWDVDAVPLHDASGNVEDVLVLVNDVTQKVLARAQVEDLALQLAAERRFLGTIMDSVPALITYLDRDLIYRQCNRAAAREFGLPVEQVLGHPLREVVPGNPQLWEAIEAVLRTGEPYPLPTITLRWQHLPGTGERHYMVAYLPDKDDAGRVRGVFAEAQDITETVEARRKLEELAEALRQARDELELRVQERTAELEAIFASLPDAVYVGDANGITRCNQIGLDNLGCQSIQDLRDKIPALNEKLQNRYADTGERIRPEDEAFARALRGQPWTYEVVSRNLQTGQDIIQRCAARPVVRDGQVIGAVAINTDITGQKRIERLLRRQQQRLTTLHELDQAILAAQSSDEIASVAVEHVRQIVGCDRVSMLAYDFEHGHAQRVAVAAGGGTGLQVGQTFPLDMLTIPDEHRRGEPHYVADLLADPEANAFAGQLSGDGLRSHLSLPLILEGKLIGCFNLASCAPAAFDHEVIQVAGEVVSQLAVALQSARLYEQVHSSREQMQMFSRRLLAVQENQARAVARELHDESGQALTALLLGLGALERTPGCPPDISSQAVELKRITTNVMDGLHRLSANLRPAGLDRLGLAAALSQHVEAFRQQTGLDAQFVTEGLGEQRLAPELETALYRIVQEALTNVARYARASMVSVLLEARGDSIVALIEDDGIGFDVEEAEKRGRLGILGMRERAEMLGGTLTVESSPGRGTCIYAEIPQSGVGS